MENIFGGEVWRALACPFDVSKIRRPILGGFWVGMKGSVETPRVPQGTVGKSLITEINFSETTEIK